MLKEVGETLKNLAYMKLTLSAAKVRSFLVLIFCKTVTSANLGNFV
jgi:hypothetical protein